MDEETRLMPVHRVGRRDGHTAYAFLTDLKKRLKKKQTKPHHCDDHAFKTGKYEPWIRISTDAFDSYAETVDFVFGQFADYGQIIKNFAVDGAKLRRKVLMGDFDEKKISTSLVERSNLTIRTFVHRFMRKTLGFSKKLENLEAATAMHFAYYNYCWKVSTIKTTPAVAAGLAKRRMSVSDLYQLLRECWPDLFFDD